jgi:hypothetical protein
MGYGLTVRRGDDYEFSFAAVEDAVKKTILGNQDEEAAQRREAVSRRRNKIEEEIRAALYQWSMRLKSEEWTESLKACLTDKRQKELGLLTRQEASSKNRSPLYFIELLKFIRHSGFYDSEQVGENISRAMDTVNRLRIDAHAKDIDIGDYANLTAALDTLENLFVPPP